MDILGIATILSILGTYSLLGINRQNDRRTVRYRGRSDHSDTHRKREDPQTVEKK